MSVTPIPNPLAERFSLRCKYHQEELLLQLRIPRLAESYPLMLKPEERRGTDAARALRCQIYDFIETVNDRPVEMSMVERWCAEESFLKCVTRRRRELFELGQEDGRVSFGCPHCGDGEVTIDLPALTLLFQTAPPPVLVEDGRHFAVPFLAEAPWPRSRRAESLRGTRSIRFELPSVKGGFTGHSEGAGAFRTMADYEDPSREQSILHRFAPPGREPDSEHPDWTWESTGFRAVLRLLLRLDHLGGITADKLTPETLEVLSIVDFLFLDAICYFTESPDLRPDPRRPLQCPLCQQTFLPIL